MEPAIVIEKFTRMFGGQPAVRDLSLEVPRGSIFGLLGQNGAGKSTVIKTLLNLHRPTAGRLSVLGLDSVADAVALRRRVGYVPEEPGCYRWMTVREALRFSSAFYPTWDWSFADELTDRLALPRERRLGHLSRGMQAKVGLVMALAFRPEVLVLDDPTSGLDPVVRREFLEAVIGDVQASGGTVFFSSHLLHEMERVADEVAILHEGRLVCRGAIEDIKARTRKLRAIYPDGVPDWLGLPGLVRQERHARQALVTVMDFDGTQTEALRRSGAQSVDVIDLSLEEIFVEAVKGGGRHAGTV